MGMSVGPIPFTAINYYAMRYRFDDLDDFDLLRRAIRAMDKVYLDFVRKQKPDP